MNTLKKLFFATVFCVKVSATPVLKTMDEILSIVRQHIPEDAQILEAGSYDGKESCELSDYWPKGMVYSFEPVSELYTKVVANTSHRSNIKTYHMALGDHVGVADIFVSEWSYKPGIAGQSSSIIAPKEHCTYAPEVIFPRAEVVPLTTIDAWALRESVKRIDMMWLDVQGVAYEVLKASPRILATTKAILIELEFVEAYEGQRLAHDVHTMLTQEGFTLMGVRPWGWFADFLYIRLH